MSKKDQIEAKIEYANSNYKEAISLYNSVCL